MEHSEAGKSFDPEEIESFQRRKTGLPKITPEQNGAQQRRGLVKELVKGLAKGLARGLAAGLSEGPARGLAAGLAKE